jgi:tetratricopeptide (TPR) repeat protein
MKKKAQNRARSCSKRWVRSTLSSWLWGRKKPAKKSWPATQAESVTPTTHTSSDRPEEALAIFEETASHFANAPDPQQREILASALYAKALALDELGRQHEAVPVLTELIERFQDDEDQHIQDVVSEARKAREEMGDGEGE